MTPSIKEWLRRGCGIAMTAALWIRSRRIERLPGPILVIAPHPDDETLGCAGLIQATAKAGHALEVLVVTDGAASHPNHPTLKPEGLVARRKAETLAALAHLGCAPNGVYFLGAPDGELNKLSEQQAHSLRREIVLSIRRVQPAAVLVPYRGDGSSEHSVVFELAVEALASAGGGIMYEYPIWAWWNPLRLLARLVQEGNFRLPLGPNLRSKLEAVKCHCSQVDPTPPWVEPILPWAVKAGCCGPNEFFFVSRIEDNRPELLHGDEGPLRQQLAQP